MDQELIAYLDERFQETSQQIQGLRDELRQTDVKVEDLCGQIQQVAEGVVTINQSLEAFRDTASMEFGEIRDRIHIYFKNLDRRVRDIELRSSQPEPQS
ncbi:MAG TPA: hypothetical protein VE078_14415 [Thermoanaerobaculia bacterium]|nr:hypothetical protein [Thermoanaerobaculia bacterium]